MNTVHKMLLALTLTIGFSPNALAEEPVIKPKLEVSEDFWPPTSYMHTVYLMNFIYPIMPERRWIGYADGRQITEIQFHKLAGLDQEVTRLKKRQNRAWTGVVGGSLLAGAGMTMMMVSIINSDSANSPQAPIGLPIGATLSFAGISSYLVGVHGLWFRGTKRAQAYKVAAEHNKQL